MAGVLTSPSGIELLVAGRYFAKNAPKDKKRASRLFSPLVNLGVMAAVSLVETWKSVKDSGDDAPNLRGIDVVESSAVHVVADVTAVAAAELVIGLGEMGWDNEWVGRGYRSVVGAWTAWRDRVTAKKEEARLKEREKEDKKKKEQEKETDDEEGETDDEEKKNIPLDQPELSLDEEVAAVKEAQKNMVENTLLAQLEKKKKEIDSLSLSSDKKKEMKDKVSEVMNDMKKAMAVKWENLAVAETEAMAGDVTEEYLEQVESKMKSKMKKMSPTVATKADGTRASLDIIAEDAVLAVDMANLTQPELKNWEIRVKTAKENVFEMEANLPLSVRIPVKQEMQRKRKAAMKLVENKSTSSASPEANMSPVTKAAVNAIIDSSLPIKMSSWLNKLRIIWDIVDEKMTMALTGD
jgi:hypothetical protein